MGLDEKTIEALRGVTTATITTRSSTKERPAQYLDARPKRPAHRRSHASSAQPFTLRFVPAREDLATPESWGSPISTRASHRSPCPPAASPLSTRWASPMPASSATSSSARMKMRSVAGLVTDGVCPRSRRRPRIPGLPVLVSRCSRPASIAAPHLRRPLAATYRFLRRCRNLPPTTFIVCDDRRRSRHPPRPPQRRSRSRRRAGALRKPGSSMEIDRCPTPRPLSPQRRNQRPATTPSANPTLITGHRSRHPERSLSQSHTAREAESKSLS